MLRVHWYNGTAGKEIQITIIKTFAKWSENSPAAGRVATSVPLKILLHFFFTPMKYNINIHIFISAQDWDIY